MSGEQRLSDLAAIGSPIDRAAIKVDAALYSLPRPNRHDNITHMVFDTVGPDWMGDNGAEIQGFLDTDGVFLTREQAMVVAMAHGQVIMPLNRDGRLYSEEMW